MTASSQVLIYLVLWTAILAMVAPTYRGIQVFFAGKAASDFPRSGHDGPAWYKRTMDAHANALENLPLYIGVFIAAMATEQLAILDQVAFAYLVARLLQSAVHMIKVSHWFVMARFTFWLVQMGLIFYAGLAILGCITI